jgi:hypothetical protein
VWLIQRVEWVLAVFPDRGITSFNVQELEQVAHGSIRAWHLGWGAGNTDVAKRVDPRHLSRRVGWFDGSTRTLIPYGWVDVRPEPNGLDGRLVPYRELEGSRTSLKARSPGG